MTRALANIQIVINRLLRSLCITNGPPLVERRAPPTKRESTRSLGWMSEKDWEETVVVLKQYGGVTSPLEAEQLYTNEFVPAGDEFIPPQTGPDKT